MKKTNKSITFQALNSYFLNTASGKINIGHLNDCVFNIFDIEYRHENGGNGKSKLHYKLINKYRKNADLIKEAFLRFTDQAIENFISLDHRATAEQLAEWLKSYNLDYTVFDPLSVELDRMRAEELNKNY